MIVNVFSGDNCCLCDDAVALLEQLQNSDNFKKTFTIEKVNIRESTQLYHLYAVRIPVVQVKGTTPELGWPFGIDELREFLT